MLQCLAYEQNRCRVRKTWAVRRAMRGGVAGRRSNRVVWEGKGVCVYAPVVMVLGRQVSAGRTQGRPLRVTPVS